MTIQGQLTQLLRDCDGLPEDVAREIAERIAQVSGGDITEGGLACLRELLNATAIKLLLRWELEKRGEEL